MDSTREFIQNRSTKSIEFTHNRALLNKCNKIRSTLIIFYAAPLAVYLPVAIFMGLSTNVGFAAFDAIVTVPLLAYFAWQGCYRFRDIMLILFEVLLITNQLILLVTSPYENILFFNFNILNKCFWLHFILLIVETAAMTVNMKVNITYHKLEDCVGFPHFNERFFDQEMDRIEFAIKNPYQRRIDDNMKTAPDNLSDVETNYTDAYSGQSKDRLDRMDEI